MRSLLPFTFSVLGFLFFQIPIGQAQDLQTENVFLITLDGLRWEELFGGADDSLTVDSRYVRDISTLQAEFWAASRDDRRKKLMPWMWSTMAKEGQILGNRRYDNKVNVSNKMWFSYPGYNEILVGYSDPKITSNAKELNQNVTVLEWLNQQDEFEGLVAAFGSWDVFPYIINDERSGIPVNAGFRKAEAAELSDREYFLNELQDQVPSPWPTVRLDAFTHHFAMEHIRKYSPRVVYIAYGETDDFAHDGRYDHYLKSARQTDAFIQELWEYCQNTDQYAGKTTFLITTDHGRGDQPKSTWTGHGKNNVGSDAIWMAAIGPDTPALGERKDAGQWWQNQAAKTLSAFLGLEYSNQKEVGPVIQSMIKP